MTTAKQQLTNLAQAYFHQDFDLEAPTPLDVVRNFAAEEPPATVGELRSELESVLASPMSDADMEELWLDECGASYDPADDGIGYRQWFSDMLSALEDANPPGPGAGSDSRSRGLSSGNGPA